MAVDIERAIDDMRSLSMEDRMRVVQAVWDSLPEQPAPSPLPRSPWSCIVAWIHTRALRKTC
jgi:hypothetical protein